MKPQEDTGHDDQINTVTYVKDNSDTSQPQLLTGKSFRSPFLLRSGMPLDALGQRRCSRMKGRSRWEPELNGVLLKSSPGTEEHMYPSMVSCITAFPGHLLMAQETQRFQCSWSHSFGYTK